jgi:hypothetical protein
VKKIAITGGGIVVLIAAIIFLPLKSYGYNNILNMLNLRDWYFKDKNMLILAETKSKNNTSFPIAYLAFMRTTFGNQLCS